MLDVSDAHLIFAAIARQATDVSYCFSASSRRVVRSLVAHRVASADFCAACRDTALVAGAIECA